MQNLIKNKSGMTIIEVLIAITLMAVISIMVFMGYFSVIAINRDTQKQIDYNALTRTVKETFTSYIKSGNTSQKLSTYQNHTIPNDMEVNDVYLYEQASKKLKNGMDKIVIKDSNGNAVYTDYYYEYLLKAGPDSAPVSIPGVATYNNTYKFEIKIGKRGSPVDIVQDLNIYVNTLKK